MTVGEIGLLLLLVLVCNTLAMWRPSLRMSRIENGGEKEESWKNLAHAAMDEVRPLAFRFPRAPHFVVAAEPWPPHVYLKHSSPSGSLKITGPMGQLMDALAASLNFTYSVVQKDGYWGAPQSDGSWNGMIGTVLRQVESALAIMLDIRFETFTNANLDSEPSVL